MQHTVISEPVGKLFSQLVRRLDNGGLVVVRDHPLPALLQKPNAWQTRLEFIKMMQSALYRSVRVRPASDLATRRDQMAKAD
jgi:phage portal protein BeeE